MDTSSVPGLELIQIADAVAREKSIDRDEVITAMEEAIQKAGRSKYGQEHDIRASLPRSLSILLSLSLSLSLSRSRPISRSLAL